MVNKKADKIKSNLTTTQQVLYSHEFKHADRAGGFSEKKTLGFVLRKGGVQAPC